jgi:hypothetical protein
MLAPTGGYTPSRFDALLRDLGGGKAKCENRPVRQDQCPFGRQGLVFPEVFEPTRCERCVSLGRDDGSMTEIALDRPGVVTIIRKFVAARARRCGGPTSNHRKANHRASYASGRGLQKRRQATTVFREISGAAQFSTFSTASVKNGPAEQVGGWFRSPPVYLSKRNPE